MPQNTDFQYNIRRLFRFLEREDESSYIFAYTDNQRQISAVNATLREQLAKQGKIAALLFLDVFSEQSILEQMRLKIAQEQCQVLIIPNLYDCILNKEKGKSFLTELNFSREAMQRIAVTKLFWLNAQSLHILSNEAVDLYQQRSLTTTHFSEQHQAEAVLDNMNLHFAKLKVSENNAPQEKSQRATFLKKQLDEALANKVAPLRIANDYALPYATELRSLGFPDEALTIISPYIPLIVAGKNSDNKKALAALYLEGGKEQAALDIYLDLLKTEKDGQSKVWLSGQIGDIYRLRGSIKEGLVYYEKCLKISEKLSKENPNNVDLKHNLGVSYSRVADIYKVQGNLAKALEYFEEYLNISKSLFQGNPNHVEIKRGLGIAYEQVGYIHKLQGNLAKALEYFEESLNINKSLFQKNSNHVEIKRSLGIAYIRVGDIHKLQGNLAKALIYFEENSNISKSLFMENPNQVEIKRDLGIAYSRVGDIHKLEGNLAKALEYFEENARIAQELCKESSTNYQNFWSLATAKEKLGDTHLALHPEQPHIALQHYKAALAARQQQYAMTGLEQFKTWVEALEEKIKGLGG
jgi:tetratricopeptide (TPR) repeat protein